MPFKSPEAKAAYMREYRKQRADKLSEQHIKWREENSESVKERQAEYYRQRRKKLRGAEVLQVVEDVKTSAAKSAS